MNEMAKSNYCSGGYRPADPLPPSSQTIESFACKVRYFSIIRFVMGSLSSTLSASLSPSLPLWLTKLMVWEVPLLCQTQFHIACCSDGVENAREILCHVVWDSYLAATVLTI